MSNVNVDGNTVQVNGWGFKRITHGSDYNSYYRKSAWFIVVYCACATMLGKRLPYEVPGTR